jgi:DNA mismatch endonuclease, patch repair protein
MADVFSKRQRSEIMSRVRSNGNRSTELRLIAILRQNQITGWRRGWPLPGKPDFVFPKLRLAVFVDGCFWHGCPKHATMPRQNALFWNQKLTRNQLRDRQVNKDLRLKQWRVVRIWEHELRLPATIVRKLSKLCEAAEA